MELYINHKFFIKILFLGIILKIILLFITPSYYLDLYHHADATTFLLEGINPYTLKTFYSKYPPLYYYISNFFGLILGPTIITYKFMVFFFDVFNVIILYKIGMLLKDKNFGNILAMFYYFNPIGFNLSIYGENEYISLFFCLVSIYFFIKKRYNLSALFLGLGTCFKIYPIILLIPYSIYLIKTSNKKQFLKFILTLLITIIVVCLPFLIISPELFIQKLIIHTSRRNFGVAIETPLTNLWWESELYVFGIMISYQFIAQLICFLILFIYGFYNHYFELHHVLIYILILNYLLPLLTLQVHLRYFGLVFLPIQLILTKKYLEEITTIDLLILFFCSVLGILITFFLRFPNSPNIFLNIEQINPDLSVDELTSELSDIFLAIPYIAYFWIEFKYRKNNDWLLFVLTLVPTNFYMLITIIDPFIKLPSEILLASLIPVIIILIYIMKKYWFKYKELKRIFHTL